MRPRALFLAGLPSCGSAAAQVSEQLDDSGYEVPLHQGMSLRELLDAATPVRSAGALYHAHTSWHVSWHYQYERLPSGRCSIASVHTGLSATMILPAPAAAALAHDPAFVTYRAALKRHEHGHYQIGEAYGGTIDSGIFTLPSEQDCAALGQAAEKFANAQLAAARLPGARYDQDTGHGRTQGAQLN